ncbi:MAG: hypothetical protein DCC57_09020 [Chloroflexi bacterium]|nr:MAG: hypothetical protein DCC57_09020 [Chloroflexota bacterium]
MTVEISLTLSEELYQRARRLARRRQQDVTAAITDYLEQHLPADEPGAQPTPPDNLPDAAVAREKAAYRKLHAQLWQQYPGHYVALHNGQLVDHDSDKHALLARIQAQFPDQFVLVRRVEATPEREYRFPSTRFIERVP